MPGWDAESVANSFRMFLVVKFVARKFFSSERLDNACEIFFGLNFVIETLRAVATSA
jgi:hypothetical protein